MVNETEINRLKMEIKRMSDRKMQYQQINREILENISDFEEIKIGIARAQVFLRESDTSEEVLRKINEMDEDVTEIKSIIMTLEDMKIEAEKAMRILENQILEKENQVKILRATI